MSATPPRINNVIPLMGILFFLARREWLNSWSNTEIKRSRAELIPIIQHVALLSSGYFAGKYPKAKVHEINAAIMNQLRSSFIGILNNLMSSICFLNEIISFSD